ncbi:hypothetical protein EB093_02475 [bacterium]|nr:hypothetical protein [bacterium]
MTRDKDQAYELIQEGRNLLLEGNTQQALDKFKESVSIFPTPEGYTLWAWMLSYDSELEECIELCKHAILLDPEFGNAYNDIGSYLIDLGRLDEAIVWLKKAKQAKHYESPQFPYLNLARVYLKLERDYEAMEEYRQLLSIDPNNMEGRFILAFLDEDGDNTKMPTLFSNN